MSILLASVEKAMKIEEIQNISPGIFQDLKLILSLEDTFYNKEKYIYQIKKMAKEIIQDKNVFKNLYAAIIFSAFHLDTSKLLKKYIIELKEEIITKLGNFKPGKKITEQLKTFFLTILENLLYDNKYVIFNDRLWTKDDIVELKIESWLDMQKLINNVNCMPIPEAVIETIEIGKLRYCNRK